jgi:glutaminyl-peptide cyclotransferase
MGWCWSCRHAPSRGSTGVPEAAPTAAAPAPATTPPSLALSHRVVAVRPHDPQAYTQGLEWHAGALLESTGGYGRSALRELDPQTGAVRREVRLDPGLFGEGLTRVGDRLVQLTWREGVALIWERATLAPLARLSYPREGWGLCFDGTHLVTSDGSAVLVWRDPATLEERRRASVTLLGRPLSLLNELECAPGAIWANVYTTDRIVRIDAATAEVSGYLDLGALLSDEERANAEVLNGIARLPASGHLLVTGKLWPKLFEIEVLAPSPGGGG